MTGESKINADGDGFDDMGKPFEPTGSYRKAERSLLDEAPPEAEAQNNEQLPDKVPDDVDDAETDKTREGFAVYEPPGVESPPSEDLAREDVEENEMTEEWKDIGKQVSTLYGDSLAGIAGYMGPVGLLLAVVSGAVIAITAGFETAPKVIGKPFLLGAAGTFIVGIYLLLFHVFHWFSNRTKRAALPREIRAKLFNETCRYVDMSRGDEDGNVVLTCNYFERTIAKVPECMACPHYTFPGPDAEGRETSGEKVEGEGDTGELIPGADDSFEEKPLDQAWNKTGPAVKVPAEGRKLLDEFVGPKIGGESGGDLDEAPKDNQTADEDIQLGMFWNEPKEEE